MNTAIIVLLCGLCAVLSAPAATMLNYMSGTNEVYTAAETDAAIVRLAPAPGNYAAVSNAAMSAVQPAELAAATNDIPRIEESASFPGYANGAENAVHAEYSMYADNAVAALSAERLGSGTSSRTADEIFGQLDAAASTTDVQLTPVYGGNGERISEWMFTGDVDPNATYEVDIAPMEVNGTWYYDVYIWGSTPTEEDKYRTHAQIEIGPTYYDMEVMQVSGTVHDMYAAADVGTITATRTENPLLGYTLGSQTDKVIAPTNGIPTRMSQLTNDVGYVTILPLTNGTIQVGFAQEAYHAGTADFATAAEAANSAESATAAQSLSYGANGLEAGAIVGMVGAAAQSATNYTDSVFADATNRIAALEAELQGLANALHVINTGTNLVTGGGN